MSDFYAKPYGGYSISSVEGTNNIKKTYDYLNPLGFTKDCIVGILGNVMAESSLNPWLWENNTVNYNNGYGLVQFTPASEYINASGIPNHAPNLSTSQQTTGADPDDAKGQLYCLANDTFGKWVSSCWRSYWSSTTYPDLYAMRTAILNTWGNGYTLTINQFKQITDYSDACFAFLACYEGPAIPNFTTRDNYAAQIKTILDPYVSGTNILFLKKFIIDRQFKTPYN